MIDIAYCFDKNYQAHFGASITSLILNFAGNTSELRIHIVTDEDSENFREKVSKLRTDFKVEININIVSDEDNRALGVLHQETNRRHYLVSSTWYRLLLPKILPSNIDKVLYLDADTIVLSDISPLFLTDINGAPIAGCLDLVSKENAKKYQIDFYINSGVLLFNLVQWREMGYTEKCLAWAKNKGAELLYSDQCVLNTYFNKSIFVLPSLWNQFISENYNIEVDNLNEGILHFITSRKPWQAWYINGNSFYYWKYLRESPWKSYQPEQPKTLSQLLELARCLDKKGHHSKAVLAYEKIIDTLKDKLK